MKWVPFGNHESDFTFDTRFIITTYWENLDKNYYPSHWFSTWHRMYNWAKRLARLLVKGISARSHHSHGGKDHQPPTQWTHHERGHLQERTSLIWPLIISNLNLKGWLRVNRNMMQPYKWIISPVIIQYGISHNMHLKDLSTFLRDRPRHFNFETSRNIVKYKSFW